MLAYCACGHSVTVQDTALGLKIVCPACGAIVTIAPAPDEPFTDLPDSNDGSARRRRPLLPVLGGTALLFVVLGILLAMIFELGVRMNAKPAVKQSSTSASATDR
jgi:hypothetical protein